MAKKAELLEKAAELKLDVSEKNTIAEIEAAIAGTEKHEVKEAAPAKSGKRSEKALRKQRKKRSAWLVKRLAIQPHKATQNHTPKKAQRQRYALS